MERDFWEGQGEPLNVFAALDEAPGSIPLPGLGQRYRLDPVIPVLLHARRREAE